MLLSNPELPYSYYKTELVVNNPYPQPGEDYTAQLQELVKFNSLQKTRRLKIMFTCRKPKEYEFNFINFLNGTSSDYSRYEKIKEQLLDVLEENIERSAGLDALTNAIDVENEDVFFCQLCYVVNCDKVVSFTIFRTIKLNFDFTKAHITRGLTTTLSEHKNHGFLKESTERLAKRYFAKKIFYRQRGINTFLYSECSVSSYAQLCKVTSDIYPSIYADRKGKVTKTQKVHQELMEYYGLSAEESALGVVQKKSVTHRVSVNAMDESKLKNVHIAFYADKIGDDAQRNKTLVTVANYNLSEYAKLVFRR